MRGFSMIEVLIALVVLALGLLGLALLQTMNLRFTQSANQRTVATNLAHELLDVARSNRLLVAQYTAITPAAVAAAPDPPCARGTAMDPDANMDRWMCEVKEALGPDATATVTQPGLGELSVVISWTDERWNEDTEEQDTSFELVTQL